MQKSKSLFLMSLLVLSFLSLASVSALSVTVHVPEKYTEVESGERLQFEVEIKYPENSERKDLRINYEVKKDGELITQSQVLKAIETQMSFIDSVVIPESSETGLYSITVIVSDYDDLYEEVSESFQVVDKKDSHLYLWIAIGSLFLLIIFILIWAKLK